MAGWYHQLNGHEFEQTPKDSDGQGSLVCYNPWGRKELDTTKRLNKSNRNTQHWICRPFGASCALNMRDAGAPTLALGASSALGWG